MANTCDKDLCILGPKEELLEMQQWLEQQSNAQAPNWRWAALYNLWYETDSWDGAGNIGSGTPDHAYGDADFAMMTEKAIFQRAFKNNPSIDEVRLLAKKYPALLFTLSHCEPGLRLDGEVVFKNGALYSHTENDSKDFDSDSEYDSESFFE